MIIVVGPLPPPVHGAALVTQRAVEVLTADGFPLLLCSTSPGSAAGWLQHHLNRLLAYVRCARTVLRGRGDATGATVVYVSLSGGLGLVYDLLITTLARLKRHAIVFHHHSFAYLTTPSTIMRAIVGVAGANQLHIALCPAMATKFGDIYGRQLRTEVISNFAFLGEEGHYDRASARGLTAIGYLSNISFEKGIDRFLDLVAELRARGSRLTGCIAGPFADDGVRSYVEGRIKQIGRIEYVGPVLGDSKSRFLSSIDLLVFPSRYPHEAQPLVIYEAQAAGVVVSGSDRGCIAQMIPDRLRLDSTASDLSGLVDQILTWEATPGSFLPERREVEGRRFALIAQQLEGLARFRDIFSSYG